ncbi:MAG: hypothetical protein WD040_09230, partial [Anaerolineales bacterium]
MTSFPVLTVLTLLPITVGIVLLFLPAERKVWIRGLALGAASTALLLSIWVYVSYDRVVGGYQFLEKAPWVPALGISYH